MHFAVVVALVASLVLSVMPAGGMQTAVAEGEYDVPATSPGSYDGLWIGELTMQSNVRSGPSVGSKVIKTWWVGRRILLYQSVADNGGGVWFRVSEVPETPMYVHATVVRKVMPVEFMGARFGGRWVNVDISQQVVTAYQGGVPMRVTLASTGTVRNPTNLGVQRIGWKLPKRRMVGGSRARGDYYDLPNVPYPQYFNNTGEALHGTYWHDNFGYRKSHGCVNLSTPMAKWFYDWATIGTTVYVHN